MFELMSYAICFAVGCLNLFIVLDGDGNIINALSMIFCGGFGLSILILWAIRCIWPKRGNGDEGEKS